MPPLVQQFDMRKDVPLAVLSTKAPPHYSRKNRTRGRAEAQEDVVGTKVLNSSRSRPERINR